jgi:hypothetical protein
MIPMRKPTSPSRVTRNALTAARELARSSQWWPIRKYEQMPMTSQPTYRTMRSPARTTSSIAAVNSEMNAA